MANKPPSTLWHRILESARSEAKRFGIMLAAIVIMLGIALGIVFLLGGVQDNAQPSSSDASEQTSLPEQGQSSAPNEETTSAPGGEGDSSAPSEDSWNFVGPVEQTINDMELVAPDYRLIALPENGAVDMSYFDTVTFLGDSITQGLQQYSTGIPNAKYVAWRGLTPRDVYSERVREYEELGEITVMEALSYTQPDNVYILLGANAMVGMRDEAILTYYREMLQYIKENLPDGVMFYVQSITPVREGNEAGFDMDRIHNLNDNLAVIAWEEDVHFVDLNEVLLGEDGFLREEYATKDGYHMNPAGYTAWKEYLVTHTAYHPNNPYLPGSPMYQGEE